VHHNPLGIPADANTYILICAGCVFKCCVLNCYVSGFSLDIDADSLPVRTIVTNYTILDPVSAAAAKFVSFVAKKYPDFTVAFDCASSDNVVSVTVSDTDSIPAVFS
jgi:hypothetical protein